MRRLLATVGLLTPMAGAATSRAQAEAEVCLRARVEVVGNLDESWTKEITRVCDAMTTLPDIDPTVRIKVVAGAPVKVIATLSDGRVAERPVDEVGRLRHTVEALAIVPPEAPLPSPTPDVSIPAKPPPAAKPADAARPRAAPPEEPLDLSVEIGALAMGRVQGTPVYAGVGPSAWAALNYSDWLFGLALRFDPYVAQPTFGLDGFEMMDFGGGLEFARRFRPAEEVGIDAGLGFQVVHELQSVGTDQGNQQGDQQGDQQNSTGGETEGDATDIRLVLLARIHAGRRGGPRFTASIEPELSPLRIGRDRRADEILPVLPAFGLGVGAGISWQGP